MSVDYQNELVTDTFEKIVYFLTLRHLHSNPKEYYEAAKKIKLRIGHIGICLRRREANELLILLGFASNEDEINYQIENHIKIYKKYMACCNGRIKNE